MKKFILTVAAAVLALCAVFAAACKPSQEQPQDAGYTVTLSAQKVALGAFERCELSAVVRDAQKNEIEQPVSWKSADESVALVSDGIIFATGAGTTEISATYEGSASAKCVVTVTDSGVIPELRVNAKSLSVGKGQKFTLVSEVFFNGKDCTESDTVFTYKCAEESVATVSQDGVITAVAAGDTKITVYALWRGIGGVDKIGNESAIAALSLTIDVKVIEV